MYRKGSHDWDVPSIVNYLYGIHCDAATKHDMRTQAETGAGISRTTAFAERSVVYTKGMELLIEETRVANVYVKLSY
jgi:hypothetical protein